MSLFGNAEPLFSSSAPPPILLVPFLASVVVLWRRGAADIVRLAAMVSLGLAVGMVSVARTIGVQYDYRLRWTWVLAATAAAITGSGLWLAVADRYRRAGPRVLAGVVLVGLVALAVGDSVSAVRSGPPQRVWTERMAVLTPQIFAALPKGSGDVLVRSTITAGEQYALGVVLQLERAGVPARVAKDPYGRYGSSRVHERGPVRASLVVVAEEKPPTTTSTVGAFDDAVTRWGQERLVAYVCDVTVAERAALSVRRAARLGALERDRAAGRLSAKDFLVQFSRLPAPPAAVGVFIEDRPGRRGR